MQDPEPVEVVNARGGALDIGPTPGVPDRALVSASHMAKSIVGTVSVPLLVLDRNLVIRHVNSAFARHFRLVPSGDDGGPLYELSDGAWNVPELRTCLSGLVAADKGFERLEIEREFAGIGSRVLCVSGCTIQELDLLLLTIEDVTTQRQAEKALHQSEEQRRQSEKMEVIGRLAGGIAHDFNNVLTIIIGNAELVADTLGPGHEAMDRVRAIGQASEKAAALTDQLLAFSRRSST
jgi:signal transduction histidine kinase